MRRKRSFRKIDRLLGQNITSFHCNTISLLSLVSFIDVTNALLVEYVVTYLLFTHIS